MTKAINVLHNTSSKKLEDLFLRASARWALVQRRPQPLELDEALRAAVVHEEVDAVVPDDAVARKDGDRDLFLDLEARAAERAGEGGAQDFFRHVPSEVPRAVVHEGFDFRGERTAAHCGHGMRGRVKRCV